MPTPQNIPPYRGGQVIPDPVTAALSQGQPGSLGGIGPIKPTQMTLDQLMSHFGVASEPKEDRTETPLWQNKPDYQVYDWLGKLRAS